MDPKLFGQRLRTARENAGLSQEGLANLVSKDQRAISEYENGKRKLAATDLPEIAEVLKVPILYFFAAAMNTDDLDYAMLTEFHQLSKNSRHSAIEVMRLLTVINQQE